jgi:glycosyltransferase 2 family protein
MRAPRYRPVTATIVEAAALWAFVRALGYPVGLSELVVINISVSLLSGLIPIPGGIGVVEGGLTFGLVHAGLPEETAFAAVLLYRLSTFYLPPVWGYFALRWLERNKHL